MRYRASPPEPLCILSALLVPLQELRKATLSTPGNFISAQNDIQSFIPFISYRIMYK